MTTVERHSLTRAVKDAFRASQSLYNSDNPLTNNLWCITKVEYAKVEKKKYWLYKPVKKRRNPLIYEMLQNYVDSLDRRSVEYNIEDDYFRKFYVARNFYYAASLRQQASVDKWFLGGSSLPKKYGELIDDFWMKLVPSSFRVLSPGEVGCPKFEASAGIVLLKKDGNLAWEYCKKGPQWNRIQQGTEEWIKLLVDAVPAAWLKAPVSGLIGAENPDLEALALERPVIRKESGPGKVRWARSSGANKYILGRMYIERIQSGPFGTKPDYIGKASNSVYGANKAVTSDAWYIGTHGDDWIAWCPKCRVWHSGDWSNWDLHVSAKAILRSYEGLRKAILPYLTRRALKAFYGLAYLAIRTPTIWLWDRAGNPSISVRRTLGKVRSGDGDFVMHNNAMNHSGTSYLLDKTHGILTKKGLKYPCKSLKFWPVFSGLAGTTFGWIAKPSAQLTHPHGFLACRCVHTRDRGYFPQPSVASVVRNWVNPSYDPEEEPNNTRSRMVARFRDINKTMAWAPDVGEEVMNTLAFVAEEGGVPDPYGVEYSDADISRANALVSDQYNTRSYLEQ